MKIALLADQQRQAQELSDIGETRHGDCMLLGQLRRSPFPEPDAGQWALYVIAVPSSTCFQKIRAVIEAERLKLEGKGVTVPAATRKPRVKGKPARAIEEGTHAR